jgi:hypothetical protein
MEDTQAALLSEQMHHALNLMRADLELLQTRLNHQDEMNNQRLKILETRSEDHEQRLRSATDGVTQFKVWSGLISASSFATALVALLKAFLCS